MVYQYHTNHTHEVAKLGNTSLSQHLEASSPTKYAHRKKNIRLCTPHPQTLAKQRRHAPRTETVEARLGRSNHRSRNLLVVQKQTREHVRLRLRFKTMTL